MGNTEGVRALVIGLAVVLFVPAIVWATVIAGVYQIVREKVRESRRARVKWLQEAQQPVRYN